MTYSFTDYAGLHFFYVVIFRPESIIVNVSYYPVEIQIYRVNSHKF